MVIWGWIQQINITLPFIVYCWHIIMKIFVFQKKLFHLHPRRPFNWFSFISVKIRFFYLWYIFNLSFLTFSNKWHNSRCPAILHGSLSHFILFYNNSVQQIKKNNLNPYKECCNCQKSCLVSHCNEYISHCYGCMWD